MTLKSSWQFCGYPRCMHMFEEYWDSVKECKKAFDLYLGASLAAHVESMMPLSGYYLQGQGVQQDMEKAVSWLATGAKLGDESSTKACRERGIDYRSAQYGLTPENLKRHGYDTRK